MNDFTSFMSLEGWTEINSWLSKLAVISPVALSASQQHCSQGFFPFNLIPCSNVILFFNKKINQKQRKTASSI